MADTIEVTQEDDRWQTVDLQVLAEKCFALVFADQTVDAAFEVSVLACDDARIAELNADFRDKPMATNVLSWPTFDLCAEQDGGIPQRPPAHETPFLDASLGDIA
ncbi:MAG: rRNA maturation RNAse YbeY, partial [Rhodobacteraceae bacterium]|nr:rRNA maturation RNAse YbeY [Paracoccaceae bacterium]